MKKRDAEATLALVRRIAEEITDVADHADVLTHLARGLMAQKQTVDAKRTCDEAGRLVARGADTDMRLAPVRARLWEQRSALGDSAGAQAGLRKLSEALTTPPRPKEIRMMIPGGDILRRRLPLAKERLRLETITNFAPSFDDALSAVALAQAHLPDAEGVWLTLKAVESSFAMRDPLSELVRTLYRVGCSREGQEALERARPYFGTRDFDLAAIAQLQTEVGDIKGAAATADTLRTDERVRYRLELRLSMAEERLKQGDRSGAASEALEIAQAAEKLQKNQVGVLSLSSYQDSLRARAASLLSRAGVPNEAKALGKSSPPETEGSSLSAEKIEEMRKACNGNIRQLQLLALNCARNRSFGEAERVARTIDDRTERTEVLRRIALIAANSLI